MQLFVAWLTYKKNMFSEEIHKMTLKEEKRHKKYNTHDCIENKCNVHLGQLISTAVSVSTT